MTVCDSNKRKSFAILESLKLFSTGYVGSLIVESDSSNVITWVFNRKTIPWKFQLLFNEIKELSASINVSFYHEVRSGKSIAYVLAKQGVDGLAL